jgi:hypothetical protein
MSQPKALAAVEYILLEPTVLLAQPMTPENLALFQRAIAFQAQGDYVELPAGWAGGQAAAALVAIYELAREAVVRLDDGRLVLLFDHEEQEKLRLEDVDETIWQEILKFKNKIDLVQDVAAPKPELALDLALLWNRTKEQTDLLARTKIFIKELATALAPAMTIILRGDIPNLPLLAAIYLARPSGHRIIFENADKTRVILFSR